MTPGATLGFCQEGSQPIPTMEIPKEQLDFSLQSPVEEVTSSNLTTLEHKLFTCSVLHELVRGFYCQPNAICSCYL